MRGHLGRVLGVVALVDGGAPAAEAALELRREKSANTHARIRRLLLILRDPYNLFASRRKGGFGVVPEETAMRIWKQHAREFQGTRRYLRLPRVLISYNRWATDSAYRREVARQLGVATGDRGVQHVPPAGNGSSFDGRRYDGRAGRMRVLSRWRHFEDDRRFAGLFDTDTRRLARQIFGDLGFAFQVSFLNKCDELERGLVAEFYQRCFNEELPQSTANVALS